MKQQQFLSDEEEQDLGGAKFCWWRSARDFEECTKFRMEVADLSKVSTRFKILRELERLALLASEGFDELRHKLLTYRSGDLWVPVGGIMKEDMDIPPVNTILLVGFHDAGKSSLVNLMYSVLSRSGLVPFAQTSSSGSGTREGTAFMEEHNVLRSTRSGFCVFDTRGFEYHRMDENLEELSKWMTDGVHHKQLCLREGDNYVTSEDGLEVHQSSMFAKRRVNCVMVVGNIAEIHQGLRRGDYKPLEALRQLFRSPAIRKSNENPILILTHGDKLTTEDRIDGRGKVCEYLGVEESSRGTYEIVCATEYGFLADEYDPISAYAVSEAIYRALLISDRGHLPKRKFMDWALLALSCLMSAIGALFALLAHLFSTLGRRNKLKW